MKPIEWVGLALAAIVIIVIIAKVESPNPALNGANNSLTSGLGGFFAALTKVSAPSANPGFTVPGSSGNGFMDAGVTNLSPSAYGAQYSAAMGATAESAASTAGNGGVSVGGGLTAAQNDPLGIGTLTAPSFDVGVNGADFSTI